MIRAASKRWKGSATTRGEWGTSTGRKRTSSRSEDAKVLGFMSLYLGPLLLIGLGAGFGFASLLAKLLAE